MADFFEGSGSGDGKAAYLEKRFQKLGFYPQKEIFCNTLLPYADQLDDESQQMLESIKNNLARAIAFSEMKPSIGLYVNQLMAYIKLYGLKFSKEDHVKLIQLLMSLIAMPYLEPVRLNRFCSVMSQLLRKTSWLSPDDLQIEWRPLFKIAKIFIMKNCSKGEFYRYYSPSKNPHCGQILARDSFLVRLAMEHSLNVDDDVADTNLENNLIFIIQKCSTYFSKESTKEILDEVFPKLYPLDTGKSCDTFALLSLFLNYNHGYELWFTDCMDMWNTYHNPSWNADLMNKISFLASENIGKIDWEPYIPLMFTRFLRSLDLPVCYKNMKSARKQSLYSSSVAIWITSVLGPNSSCQAQLKQFLGAIESYLHPANAGKWVNAMSEIIVMLPKYFTDRLIRERYKLHPWKAPVPDSHKLTENCITAFVESLKPIAYQSVYSRMHASDVSRTFKYLADLRPELIIPGVVDRVYQTLDSLTEPHKMTASLQCLVSVSRALVSGHNGYTLGKTHVIPILFATLPGIDPNDFRKTSITLEYLTSLALLVPIIDCSKAGQYYTDLTEEEVLICDQTAEFEGFVLQYMDKVFTLIESSSQVSIQMEQSDSDNRRSKLETIAEAALQSSMHGILSQCSDAILTAATRKLTDFIKSNQFEPKVAAQMVASLVRVFTRIASVEMRKVFVPYLLGRITDYIKDHDDIDQLDKQSDEFHYYIIMLISVVRGNPNDAMDLVDDILPIIDRISKFKCHMTNKYANAILLNFLVNVSTLQALDVRSSPLSFSKPLKEYLPIRHWGEKSEEPIAWYMPDERAKAVCEKVIMRYLVPLLESFDKFVAGELEMTREEILRDVSTVLALLKCPNFMPNWDATEEEQKFDPQIQARLGFEHLEIKMPDGENVRLAVIRRTAAMQEKVLREHEDDIKAQKAIILIWERVYMRRHFTTPYDIQQKSFKLLNFFQEYTMTNKRRDIRAILATRVLMQQDCRDEVSKPNLTSTHEQIMLNLLKLSTSHYSGVRMLAQNKLFQMMQKFRQSERLLEEVIKYLALDPNTEHEAFKGILYVITGTSRGRMIVRNDWTTIERLWLALLQTRQSEKPSVVQRIDFIIETIHNEFPTISIVTNIPDDCIQLALSLATRPNLISDADRELAKTRLIESNSTNLLAYNNLMHSIIRITDSKSLHWRYGLMASSMILNLVHPEVVYPLEVMRYCVNNLINESIEERKLAVQTIRYILKQHKQKHVKVAVDPFAQVNIKRPDTVAQSPGVRADNRWLQYSLDTIPKSQAEWDEPRYSHKAEGFFGWSSKFEVYAPNDQQPSINRSLDKLNSSEQVLLSFFGNSANVQQLVKFWSLEQKRGHEQFNRSRCLIVKSLCDLFGMVIVDQLLPHIDRLIRAEKNLEASHRCAAELMGGIMRGLKHWNYADTDSVYERLKPMIRMALERTTTETDIFWGTCFATAAENFDPHRQYWLHEVLLEDPLRQSTSFIDCIRIYCLQGVFNQHVWRMTSVSHRLLDYLRPYLNHSFQNVRERLGSIMINIFELDLQFRNGVEPECPRIKDFIAEVLGKLEILKEDYPSPKVSPDGSSGSSAMDTYAEAAHSNTEYDEAVRLFKTVCQWLVGVLNRNTNGNVAEYFDLLPIACRLERCEQDAELARTCSSLLALLSQSLTLPTVMPVALRKIDDVSQMPSWSARFAVIDVLQVLVFNNMPIILSIESWVQHVQSIVLRLLEDSVLEVREKAAQVLGGLLHCSFLPATDKLLELFKRKCRTKVLKNTTRRELATTGSASICAMQAANSPVVATLDTQEADSVRTRHMGVLGLCAFISAYPYEIPDFVPDVFEHLGAHLNDPQPISSTIRKTVGDFKRTHHDNWATHQLKFTENQLAVLTDLTIPPSYYA